MCVAVVPCLGCYSGKEAPCLLHRVTTIATLHIFWQQCRRKGRRQVNAFWQPWFELTAAQNKFCRWICSKTACDMRCWHRESTWSSASVQQISLTCLCCRHCFTCQVWSADLPAISWEPAQFKSQICQSLSGQLLLLWCLPVFWMSPCLSVCPYISLFVYLSVHLSVRLSACLLRVRQPRLHHSSLYLCSTAWKHTVHMTSFYIYADPYVLLRRHTQNSCVGTLQRTLLVKHTRIVHWCWDLQMLWSFHICCWHPWMTEHPLLALRTLQMK